MKKLILFVAVGLLCWGGNAFALSFGPDYWTFTDENSRLEITKESPGNSESDFGLYYVEDIQNPINPVLFQVFAKADEAETTKFVVYDAPTMTLNLFDATGSTLLGSSNPFGKVFGFYFDSTNGGPYFTDAALNGGVERIVTSYAPAIELATISIEDDYDLASPGQMKNPRDMVVNMTDIAPVPEPGTLILLGSGLIGAAAYGIRRKKNS